MTLDEIQKELDAVVARKLRQSRLDVFFISEILDDVEYAFKKVQELLNNQ